MLTIAYYFLQVVLCSGLLMGYYLLVLRNKRFHQYNRFYLLAAAALSCIVPLIKIQWSHAGVQQDPQMIRLLWVVADNNSQIDASIADAGFRWSWSNAGIAVYLLVSVILLMGMVMALYRIYTLLKKHSCKNVDDVYLIFTRAKGTPFSFFRYIFWNEEIDIRSESGKQILQHELTHVRQKHSFDKIFIQSLLVICWFNPFFWLMKKEMDMIHEFIADNKAVKNGDTAMLAQMLLATAFPQQQFALGNPFFFSPIKRRLQMLANTANPRFSYIRRLVVLPMLAVLVILFSFRSKEQRANAPLSVSGVVKNILKEVSHADTIIDESKPGGDNMVVTNIPILSKTYTLVLDAGHGGKDRGVVAEDGTSESSLALRLAKKIQSINANQNLRIILRRDDDSYQPVQEATEKINRMLPDLFISLHMNGAAGTKASGYDFYIPQKDRAFDYKGSQLLASSLAGSVKDPQVFVRGIKTREKGIYILDNVKSPAVMIEAGFLSNADDLRNLEDDKKLTATANRILDGVNGFLLQKEKAVVANEPMELTVGGLGVHLNNQKDTNGLRMSDSVLIVLDGLIIPYEPNKIVHIAPENIDGIAIKKGTQAFAQYGPQGLKGVIEITTKDYARLHPDKRDTILSQPMPQLAKAYDQPAHFPGGNNAFALYLQKNLNLEMIRINGGLPGRYTVDVVFTVDEYGDISKIWSKNDPGFGTKNEAERVIKKGPKWVPAELNGKPVASTYTQTITFYYNYAQYQAEHAADIHHYYYFSHSGAMHIGDELSTGKEQVLYTEIKSFTGTDAEMRAKSTAWAGDVRHNCANKNGCTSDTDIYESYEEAKTQFENLKKRYQDKSKYDVQSIFSVVVNRGPGKQ